jgi:hypothetical protein
LPVTLDLSGPVTGPPGTPLFVWKVNGTAIDVDWSRPIVDYILEGNTSFPASQNLVHIDTVDQWAYWLVENDPDNFISLPHPLHLHVSPL